MNSEQKRWWQSKAVWGGLVAIVASVLAYFGYDVSPEDRGLLTDGVLAIAAAVGGALAVWGRVKADRKIGK